MKNRKGLPLIYESSEDKEKRIQKMEKRWEIAKQFGVDLTTFDDNLENDETIFKTSKDKQQYAADVLMLSALLNAGNPIPKDLQERLLRVKKLCEQFKYNNDK